MKDWLTPKRTALLLIDMQRDFVDLCGAPGQAAIANATSLADAARAAGVMCVFVRLISKDESPFFREWKSRRGDSDPMPCREGTRGAEFVGPKPLAREMVFSKERYSAFSSTGLDAALRAEGIDTLVVAGLTTECCIDSSVRDAFERDYHVFVVGDATACGRPQLHDAALKALALNCAKIVSTAEIVGLWKI